MPIHGPFWGF